MEKISPWVFVLVALAVAVVAVQVPAYFGPTDEECRQLGPKECRYIWGDR